MSERWNNKLTVRLISVMVAAVLALPLPVFAEGEIPEVTENESVQTKEETIQEETAQEEQLETPTIEEPVQEGSSEDNLEEPYEEELPEEALPVEEAEESEVEIILSPVNNRPALYSTTINGPVMIKASGKAIDLRTMLGEASGGYSVVQGSCTDGTYAYYMMVSSANQMGRLLKVRMSDNTVVGRSAVADVYHGNGICYDSKRNLIVSATYHDKRQTLAFFDASSLAFKGFQKVKFSHYANAGSDSISSADRNKGLTAIAYNKTYDCYIGMESSYHNIIVYDASTLEALGKAITNVNGSYPEVWQSMDADDKYVYYVLSPGSGQPYNVILCLDWHSENLQLVRKYGKPCVEKAWHCGNGQDDAKRDGRPSAVIRLNTPYEAESLYHVTDPNTGKAHFYLSEYHGEAQYGWVTKKVKVKWKKVKKKVKWKKVKIKKGKNKGKYKWKYKTKKVWKYKTKKVKVKERIGTIRYGRVYDLGTF